MSDYKFIDGFRGLRCLLSSVCLALLFTSTKVGLAQSGGSYDLSWSTVSSGGGTTSGGTFFLSGTVGQHDAQDLAGGSFELRGGYWESGAGGGSGDPCPGVDGVPDECNDLDVCTCDACVGGSCQNTPKPTNRTGDVNCSGGTSATLDDIIYVLNGFSAGNPGFYANFPNADIAPLCTGNGSVNLDDIIAILNQFALGAGMDPCCGGPAPAAPVNQPALSADKSAEATVVIEPSVRKAVAGQLVEVNVYLEGSVNVRGFQVGIRPLATRSGNVVLESVYLDESRRDYVFAGEEAFSAVDTHLGRIAGALLDYSIASPSRAYVGTFVYSVPEGVVGPIEILATVDTLLRDVNGEPIAVGAGEPAVIVVTTPALGAQGR